MVAPPYEWPTRNRAADTIECALDRRQVLFEGVQAILNGDHLVPVGLQCRNDFAETRAIGPNAVAENDRWFGLRRHTAFPFLERSRWRALEDLERGCEGSRCAAQTIRS